MTARHNAARNREAARLEGESTFTGSPCRAAGHCGTRYTSTGACVACMADRYKATRAAPEQVGRPPAKIAAGRGEITAGRCEITAAHNQLAVVSIL